ncbi:MAG: universal stress protein [Sinomicrobium sp.]|nr:universal stress protein [Sinomicrobium sp.]
MKNILVPLGINNKRHLLQYAIDFARVFGAKLYVFRAYSSVAKAGTLVKIDEILERESLNFINEALHEVDKKDVEIIAVTGKGDAVENIAEFSRLYSIDIVLLAPRSNSIREEVFLGKMSGKIVKHTRIPLIVVPEGYSFSPINSLLMAFKSGIMDDDALEPLKRIAEKFGSEINLLLVKTPGYREKDLVINPVLDAMKKSLTISENATTFQGVLEHFQSHRPDMLCVLRRKRGFFTKLWEKNTILKREFYCPVPLLVLNGKI